MKFPDVESMVRLFLLPVAQVPISTKVPATRPATFIRAWRTGGAAVNRVLETPIITVQVWAGNSLAALEIASDCRHALLNDHSLMPLVRGVEEITGPYFDPDPVSGVDRYTFSVQLKVRAKRVP